MPDELQRNLIHMNPESRTDLQEIFEKTSSKLLHRAIAA
jgi:hypothetical protein